MSAIRIQLPESLHDQVKQLADREKVSVDQLITLAVAEKMCALMAEEYLENRATCGDRQKFKDALAKVPDAEPESPDQF